MFYDYYVEILKIFLPSITVVWLVDINTHWIFIFSPPKNCIKKWLEFCHNQQRIQTLKKSVLSMKVFPTLLVMWINWVGGKITKSSFPSSSKSERVFSVAGNMVTPKMAKLSTESTESLVIIKTNLSILREIMCN